MTYHLVSTVHNKPSRSSKTDDFHVIWKLLRNFVLVVNSKLSPIFYHFWDTITCGLTLKICIENYDQTDAEKDMVTTDSI